MTVKVSFRRVRKTDLRRLNDIINEREVINFLHLKPPVSVKSTRELYERYRRGKKPWYCILVDGVVAGSMTLIVGGKDTKQAHTASFGIALSREYWGLDVGDKAIDFIFCQARKRKLKRIGLEVAAANKRARRLYSKHGFVREGVKKKSLKISSKYADTIMMARWLT